MKNNSKITYNSAIKMYTSLIPKDKALKQEGLSLFIQLLKNKGYSINTVRLYYFAILKTLKDLGVEIKKIELPAIEEDEVHRHIYTNEEIEKLIQRSKALGGIYSKAMALSTTYGLRRTEISNLSNDNINIYDKILKVKSAKGGKTVNHAIPIEIIKYLDNNIKFMSNSSMTKIFSTISDYAGLKVDHAGWHSIRRALVSGLLLNEVPQDIVLGFMRWKTRTMLDIYHIRNPREDIVVFEKHPFLRMWK